MAGHGQYVHARPGGGEETGPAHNGTRANFAGLCTALNRHAEERTSEGDLNSCRCYGEKRKIMSALPQFLKGNFAGNAYWTTLRLWSNAERSDHPALLWAYSLERFFGARPTMGRAPCRTRRPGVPRQGRPERPIFPIHKRNGHAADHSSMCTAWA